MQNQDVDFLKLTKISTKLSLLWVLPLVFVLLIYGVIVFNDYQKVKQLKMQWSAIPVAFDVKDDPPLTQKQWSNHNVELNQFFNYFAMLENEVITVTAVDLDQSFLLKASGEANNIQSISTLVSAMAQHPLFKRYSDYRLSVNQLNANTDGMLWSIEWSL